MKDMRELVGDLSQTNHYMVSFSTLNSTLMSYIQNRIGFQEDVRNFLSRKTGLLCSEASLPTSSFATGEVRDNFMGIPQEFAHTRLYTDIDFTFYVDTNYVNLKIFESWMDYISGGSETEISELNEDYYRRMRYPDTYKVQTMFISKFERDFNSQIDYQFINAFPKLVTAIPVSYGAADLLKVSVQFTYDRYIVNPRGSIRKSNTSGFNDISRVSNDSTSFDLDQNFFTGGPVPFNTDVNLGISENIYDTDGAALQRNPEFLSTIDKTIIESRKAPVAPVSSPNGSTAVTGQNALEVLLRRYPGDSTRAYAEYDKIRYGNTAPKGSF